MTCLDVRGDAAVAILAREPMPDEVLAHLDGCELCAREVQGLVDVGPLLELAPAPDPDVGPDDEGLARLLGAVVAERRRRRVGMLAVAASVLLVLAGVVGAAALRSSAEPAVVASAAVRPAGVGVAAVEMTVSGVDEGTACTVTAVTATGQRYDVTSWTSRSYGQVTLEGSAPVRWRDIARVELVDDTGHVLASVPPEPPPSA